MGRLVLRSLFEGFDGPREGQESAFPQEPDRPDGRYPSGCALSPASRTPSPSRPSSPTFAALGPPSRPALPHPPRPQSGRLPARSGPRSLTLAPCTPRTRALTASPRPRRITGGQRARLTPTLAFAPSNAPLQARPRGSRGRPHCPDAGRPRGAGVNRSYALAQHHLPSIERAMDQAAMIGNLHGHHHTLRPRVVLLLKFQRRTTALASPRS
jgi:hypothetical protein